MKVRIGRVALITLVGLGLALPVVPADGTAMVAAASQGPGWAKDRTAEDGRFRKDVTDGDAAESCDIAGAACAGQAIVRFKAGYSPADVQDILDQFGATVIDDLKSQDMALLEVSGNSGNLIAALGAENAVKWAEFNTVDQQPIGSPRRFNPYAFSTPSSTTEEALDASAALDAVKGERAASCVDASGVTVAVIDTGVDASHPFLSGHTTAGFNAFTRDDQSGDAGNGIDDDNDGQIDGAVGHGTHVAGIIRQVAPGATIMPIKALDSEGAGQAFYIAVAMDRALSAGADVINLSLGASMSSQAVTDLLDAAKAANVVVAVAGGNDGVNIAPNGKNAVESYPAAVELSNIAGVAATVDGKKLADFSSRYAELDLAAPGEDVISALPVDAHGIETGWATWSGTSMATGWVSGAAANVIAQHPEWSAGQVLDHLEETATNLAGNTGRMDQQTRLDAAAAVCGK